MRALLLLLLLVLLAGCTVCSPENCPDGCCDARGQCIVEPKAHAECGLGGGACVDCAAQGMECVNSQCALRCSPVNCAGCCAGTQCIPFSGQSNLRCGAGGITCTVCAKSCSSAGVCQ